MDQQDRPMQATLPVPVADVRLPAPPLPPVPHPPADDEIDLRELWRIVLHHRWTVLSVCVVVVTSTALASLLMRPTYRATALVEIRPERALIGLPSVEAGPDLRNRDHLETQVRILRSESVSTGVIERLGLRAHPEFTGGVSQRGLRSGLAEVRRALGLPRILPREGTEASRTQEWEVQERFLERLQVFPERDASLVRVSFESFDPELASLSANAIVEEFVRFSNRKRFDSTAATKAFLEQEISVAQGRLEDSERRLNHFARRENIVDVDGKADLIGARVTELSSQLTEAVASRIAAESAHDQVRGPQKGLPSALESELATTLRDKRARLSAEYERLARIFKPDYPKLVQLRAEIRDLDASVHLEGRRGAERLRGALEESRRREALIHAELEVEKSRLLDLKDRAIQYHILKREWETNRELHAGLLEQLKQVGVATGVELNGISVVDPARVPVEPASPRVARNVVLSGGVGLGLGVLLALLLGYLDDVVRTPQQLESVTGLPSLGSVPKLSALDRKEGGDPERISLTRRWCPTAEALRSVRANLLLSARSGRARVIQITSAMASEGKTTTAVNLAILLASPALRVLLVDADLRRPRIHEVFGVTAAPGLTDVLRGKANVVPRPTSVTNLSVLPGGEACQDPGELLGSLNMEILIETLGESFDYVVIDSAPVLPLADSTLISTRVEGVLLVVSAESTRRDAAYQAVRRLRLVGSPLVGAVLNRADHGRGGEGYYGPYDGYGVPGGGPAAHRRDAPG